MCTISVLFHKVPCGSSKRYVFNFLKRRRGEKGGGKRERKMKFRVEKRRGKECREGVLCLRMGEGVRGG
jgi:hypothetical protein